MKFIGDVDLDKFDESSNNTILHYTGAMLGIGGIAYNKEVAQRINFLKERDNIKGFIVLIADYTWLDNFNLSKEQKRIMRIFWPGNLTIILKNYDYRLSHITVSNTIAFRVPNCDFLLNFINDIKLPLISTSINKSGEPFATSFREIEEKYKDWFDFSLINLESKIEIKSPSTIIDFTGRNLKLVREGEIPFSYIKKEFAQI